jgi:light-regulated signal transduction histidine kinase (bacteriophytochrome)
MKKTPSTPSPTIPPTIDNVSEQLNFKDCDLEQIQLSGHIQPYGILIGIDELAAKIVQVSENIVDFCGVPAIAVIDQSLECLFPQSQIDIFTSFSVQKDLEILNPIKVAMQIEDREYLFHGVMHRSDGLLILELEALSENAESDLTIYRIAQSAAASVRKAADFNEMIDLVVRKVREITQYDRVLIYKFDHDDSGDVIAECQEESLESLLGLHYPATDISSVARNLYCLNWVRLIVDINYQPVPILPPQNPLTGEPLDLSFSLLRSISKFHVRYLGGMGVCGSLCISLINDDQQLWGMIVCHHYSPKYIDYKTRKTCEFIGQLMSVSIINKHEKLLYDCSLKIKQIQAKLKQNILGSAQLMGSRFTDNGDDLLNLVNAQGVVICLDNRTSTTGQCPSSEFINKLLLWLKSQSQDLFYTNNLSGLYPEAIAFKELASGILAISIVLNHTSYHIIWFRPEVIQTVNWAGNPNQLTELINTSNDENFPCPGRSFELWKETVKAKSLVWNNVEIEAAMELRGTLMLTALEFSQQELKQEAERANVASQAKSSFLARMSHELRTPLNAILGCTQLMESENLTKVIQEYVGIIGHSSEHLLDLIDDILEVSKIEAGKITLEETIFDFHQLIKGVQEMIQLTANSDQTRHKSSKLK